MPVRSESYVERCSVCDERAEHGCERCGRPLCAEHRSSDESRCERCEREYADDEKRYLEKQLQRIEKEGSEGAAMPIVGLGAGTLAAMFLGFSYSIGWTLIAGGGLLVLGLIGVLVSLQTSAAQRAGMLELLRSQHRTRFLSERPRRQLMARSGTQDGE